jgi:hypothetical protein
MKRVFFTFLSAAAVCAFVSATPTLAATAPGVSGTAAASGAAATAGAPGPGVSGTAAASGAAATGTAAATAGAPAAAAATAPAPGGADSIALGVQAQDHPEMADQVPAGPPPGVAEVYPHGRSFGYGPAAMVTAPFDAATALVAVPFDAAQAYVAPPSHVAGTHSRCHVTRDFYGTDGRLTSVCRF